MAAGTPQGELATKVQLQEALFVCEEMGRMSVTKLAFENLGMEEWWATYEGHTGIRYWGLGLAQFQKTYPQIRHELGGARVFFNTRDQWFSFAKPKYEPRLAERLVPNDLLKQSMNPKAPEKIDLQHSQRV